LWLARQRAADLEQLMRGEPNFPVAREARREALEDVLDVAALSRVLGAVEKGEIEVVAVRRSLPSPFASDLQLGFAMAFLYEGDSPRLERRARALAAGRDAAALLLPPEELEELIEPDAVADLEAGRQHMAPGTRARTPEELAEVFRRLGDLSEAEVAARVNGDAAAALAPLLAVGRVVAIARAGAKRLILDEDAELWRDL
jgi:ATP-dependent Lhr-like helicase